ncbi:uncharacterized protein CIMG_04395 [Coccidioides immitis RS]|uniref:Cytochrome oxidase c assembly-domain-containing protein n=3 Tax=Coccidioides immitis TaxID=5501 RepID=J3KDE1_COCIM|nr:uncharacterized protein CIMG_04395 [Coccidioides immitis RS]EAS33371.3 hypothetical protein CIMG_04395 [Coccidioides immitis RS]KMP04531.1 hypothetical protein CIRG_04212 [Coccidioides immitis RMSCC 2394]TPX21121.1 hypothetical protein DIZ76_015074 [Coccidioides immitis]
MSRSTADATRFTATAPHAHSKPGSTASRWPGMKLGRSQEKPQPATGGDSQETPKQKVERLRAEARAARIAKSSSPMDRIIGRGRVWADRVHKVTVFTIIAASGIAGILTIYSATSLISHNRRQKALWIDRELQKLLDARKAYVAGTATPEQIQLLEKEKAADEEKKRKEELKKETTFYKAKSWLFGGMKQDEVNESASAQLETGEEKSKILEAINAKAADAVVAPTDLISQENRGDRGTDAAQTITSETKKGWASWLTGR